MVTRSDPLLNDCRDITVICEQMGHNLELKALHIGLKPQGLKSQENELKVYKSHGKPQTIAVSFQIYLSAFYSAILLW